MKIVLTQNELLDAIKIYLNQQGFDVDNYPVDFTFSTTQEGDIEIIIENLQFKTKIKEDIKTEKINPPQLSVVEAVNNSKIKRNKPVIGEEAVDDALARRMRKLHEESKKMSFSNPRDHLFMKSESEKKRPVTGETLEELGFDPTSCDAEIEGTPEVEQ